MPLPTKDRQKLLLILAGTALALLVADSFILSPMIASWKARSQEITDLRAQVSDGTQTIRNGAWTHGHWDQMRTNALPSNVSQAEGQMLKAFDRWERKTGVTRVSIKPQWKQPEDDYMTLECRADYTGDMARISRFLYEVENDPMGLKVENIEITSQDNNGRMLSLGLEISGLLLNPPPQAQQP